MGKRLVYKGKEYKSIRKLAEDVGMSYDTLRYRMQKGMSVEEAVDGYIVYMGRRYTSLNKLADGTGINYSTLRDRVNRGMGIKEAVEAELDRTREGRVVVYKGREYPNLSEFSKHIEISVTTLQSRLKRGMSIEEAVETELDRTRSSVQVVYKGKTYKSFKSFSEAVGVDRATLKYRLKKGMSLEEAVELGIDKTRVGREVVYKGKKYKSLNAFSKCIGIGVSVLNYRMKRGMSLEEAVEVKLESGRDGEESNLQR